MHARDDLWDLGQTDATLISIEVLFTRIAEAVVWCEHHASDQNTLPSMRSEKLRPHLFHNGRDDAVCNLGSSRHWLIENERRPISSSMPDLQGGRLLVYFPDANLCDGAAEAASKGFFDFNNTPPWDTWIAYFDDASLEPSCYGKYLLAVVPKRFVALAEEGISVNPEACIAWLSDADMKLRCRLAMK